jgi:hypothetical protein
MTGVYRHDPQPMPLVIRPAWPLMVSRAGSLGIAARGMVRVLLMMTA